jgi:hypothetical protein
VGLLRSGVKVYLRAKCLKERPKATRISVSQGQVEHEMKHLKTKLAMRDPERLEQIETEEKQNPTIKIHPLFKVTKGRVDQWEKVTDNLDSFPYNLNFKKIDFRKHPELYKVGIGEQGVLLVEPYKSEILPHWRFATPKIALASAKKIYLLFNTYKKAK